MRPNACEHGPRNAATRSARCTGSPPSEKTSGSLAVEIAHRRDNTAAGAPQCCRTCAFRCAWGHLGAEVSAVRHLGVGAVFASLLSCAAAPLLADERCSFTVMGAGTIRTTSEGG